MQLGILDFLCGKPIEEIKENQVRRRLLRQWNEMKLQLQNFMDFNGWGSPQQHFGLLPALVAAQNPPPYG